MELCPCDCLKIICDSINDRDFINLLLSSKYLYSLQKYNLKIMMMEQHKLSKIENVKCMYVFTNIFYDFIKLDCILIPDKIREITFRDNFNETFNELYNFKHLTKINIGMYYYNDQLFCEMPNMIINKNELAMTVITNRVFANLFNIDINLLRNNFNNKWFLNNFKRMYDSNYGKYEKMRAMVKNIKNVYDLCHFDVNYIYIINLCINKSNEYELYYFRKSMLELLEDSTGYFEFMEFHIEKILDYLIKLKNTICENHVKNRIEFSEPIVDEGMFKLQDVKQYLLG